MDLEIEDLEHELFILEGSRNCRVCNCFVQEKFFKKHLQTKKHKRKVLIQLIREQIYKEVEEKCKELDRRRLILEELIERTDNIRKLFEKELENKL